LKQLRPTIITIFKVFLTG